MPDGGNFFSPTDLASLVADLRNIDRPAFERMTALRALQGAAANLGDVEELITVVLESPDFKEVWTSDEAVEERDFRQDIKMPRSQALAMLNQFQALASGQDLEPIVEGDADLERFPSVEKVLEKIKNLKPTLEVLILEASIPELEACLIAFGGFERLLSIKRSLADGGFASLGETIKYKITIPGIGLREFNVSKDLFGGMMQ